MTTQQRIDELLQGYNPGNNILEKITLKNPMPQDQYLILKMMRSIDQQVVKPPLTRRLVH